MKELSVIEDAFSKLSDTIAEPDFCLKYRIGDASFTRQRKLTFDRIVLFILGLTQKSLPTAIEEFLERHPDGELHAFTKQAISHARQKVSPECFQRLHEDTAVYIDSSVRSKEWNGYKILAVDGTALQLPDNQENKDVFGANITTSAVKHPETPMARAAALFDVTNDLIIRASMETRYTTERDQAIRLMEACPVEIFKEKTIILFDRGYPSRHMYKYFFKRNGYFLMRAPNITLSIINELPLGDHVIEYNAGLAEKVNLRVVKFMLSEIHQETLVTNVLDEHLTIEKMKELYFLRWAIESKYKELKSILKIENFSGVKNHSGGS